MIIEFAIVKILVYHTSISIWFSFNMEQGIDPEGHASSSNNSIPLVLSIDLFE